MRTSIDSFPTKLRQLPGAVVMSGALLLAACSGGEETGMRDIVGASAPAVADLDIEGDAAKLADTPETTTTIAQEMSEEESDIFDRLAAAGYNPEFAAFLFETAQTTLHDADDCVAYIEDAKDGNAFENGFLETLEDGTVAVNIAKFITAGEGVRATGGENEFADSVGPHFAEDRSMDADEAAEYFANPENQDELTEEAFQEVFARMCGDRFELAGGLVGVANATFGSSDVRIGEIYEVLAEYMVDGEVNEETLTAKLEETLAQFEVRFPEGVDTAAEREAYVANMTVEEAEEWMSAYDNQLLAAAKLNSVLKNFTPTLNDETVHVEQSTLINGVDAQNYPKLAWSNQPVDAERDSAETVLGGSYNAQPGSLLMFIAQYKGGCVVFEEGFFAYNTTDGRFVYSTYVPLVETCAIEEVAPTTTTTEVPVTITTTTTAAPTATTEAPASTTTTTEEPEEPEGNKGDASVATTVALAPSTTEQQPQQPAQPTVIDGLEENLAPADTVPGNVTPTTHKVAPVPSTLQKVDETPITAAPPTTSAPAATTPTTDAPANSGQVGSR